MTSSGGTDPTTIHEAFARRAAATPDAVAVVDGRRQLTYRQLRERAAELAGALRSRGVRPATAVGVHLPRTVDVVVAALAVLGCGAVYVPLDPANPDERLQHIVADAGIDVVVTDDATLDVPTTIAPDAVGSPAPGAQGAPATGSELAYVIYTSGSTGRPKGVQVEHRNLLALLRATQPLLHFDERDVWSLCASIGFDVSVWEMWGALLHGGRLVVVPDEVRRSPDDLLELLHRAQVTVLNQTPGAFRGLIRADGQRTDGAALALRTIVLAGEALRPAMLAPWFDRHGDDTPAVINMYGITETTVHSTYRRMRRRDTDSDASVIGRPIDGWTMQVRDEAGEPCPPGVAGELYVGGAGVARGYVRAPELTAARFRTDPLDPGRTWYRSGDAVRCGADGDHEYLGRLDDQIKIRGFRVEPGEIESALERLPQVREAAVVGHAADDEQRLIAYWVRTPGATDEPRLRDELRRSLPDYMVPSAFVELAALPLTGNGKLDRGALPDPHEATSGHDAVEYVAPQTTRQGQLAAIWAEVLKVDRVGLDDDFFDLGGHSMLAARVVALAKERHGAPATLRLLFDESTLRGFADAVAERDR